MLRDYKIGRLWTPICETFSYGIQHISLWFNELWPYVSLNHNLLWKYLTYGSQQSPCLFSDNALEIMTWKSTLLTLRSSRNWSPEPEFGLPNSVIPQMRITYCTLPNYMITQIWSVLRQTETWNYKVHLHISVIIHIPQKVHLSIPTPSGQTKWILELIITLA